MALPAAGLRPYSQFSPSTFIPAIPINIHAAADKRLLLRHPGAPALVIGQYLEQLKGLAGTLGAPLITGQTAQRERERLYQAFRAGELPVLVLSKVGNFALDLPDAEVLVQVSGAFGSRQEEAQRLGRVLRPKDGARQGHWVCVQSRVE